MKVVFMGTPHIAAYMMEELHNNAHHQIVGVVTVADKKVGRGQKIAYSAVKEKALELGLPITQPEKLKSDEFLDQLKAWNADVFVVVAFRMLPESVWSLPEKGCINLHASLLPQYRGAAPINWAIINGEKETGVTTFLIEKEIDTGAIIEQVTIPIAKEDNAGTLHDKIMVQGAKTVQTTLDLVEAGNYTPLPQTANEETLKPAPKIFKEDCKIDWTLEVPSVISFIKGMSPYPGAFTTIEYKGKELFFKIFDASIHSTVSNSTSSPCFKKGNEGLIITTKQGAILLKEVQLQGKRKILAEEFEKGFQIDHASIKD